MIQEIKNKVRPVLSSLEMIRDEKTKQSQLSSLEDSGEMPGINEDPLSLKFFNGKLDGGILDAEFMIKLMDCIEEYEAERDVFKYHIKRLHMENTSLREELEVCREKYKTSEGQNTDLEEENRKLKLMAEIQQKETVEFLPEIQDSALGINGSKVRPDRLSNGPFNANNGDGNIASDRDESEQENSMITSSMMQSQMNSQVSSFDIPPRLRTLHTLVIQYANNNRYEVAVPLCKQALDDLVKNVGKDHPDVATLLNILALLYRDQNKYKEAVSVLNESLAIREKVLGLNHPMVAATLNNLAVLYGRRGKFKEAEPLCRRALQIREAVFGSEHPDVAKQMNNLGLLFQKQKKYSEAIPVFKQAEMIYEKNQGPQHLNVLKTMSYRAQAHIEQNNTEQAETIHKEIINRAHAGKYGSLDSYNRSIAEFAEERENPNSPITNFSIVSFADKHNPHHQSWVKAISLDNQVALSSIKTLIGILRASKRNIPAEVYEQVTALKAKKTAE